MNGQTDIVSYLLDRGAVIDEIPDKAGRFILDSKKRVMSALCMAAWRGRPAVVKLPLQRGADPGFRDSSDMSAVELARKEGDQECVDVLKEYTATT